MAAGALPQRKHRGVTQTGYDPSSSIGSLAPCIILPEARGAFSQRMLSRSVQCVTD